MVIKYRLEELGSANEPLHGIVAEPSGNPQGLVIHAHGTWGNFYGNSFIPAFAEEYTNAGWSFASVNFPGHDEHAMSERMEDFSPALDSWIDKLNEQKVPVVLQGHSLGALKILSYLQGKENTPPQIKALVALAAFDCVGFYRREVPELDALLDGHSADTAIVDESYFPHWLLRWGTLRELSAPGGPWDIFRSRLGSSDELLDGKTNVPSLFVVGEEDFAAIPSGETVHAMANKSPYFSDAVLVRGAPHNFSDYEAKVASIVVGWVKGLA